MAGDKKVFDGSINASAAKTDLGIFASDPSIPTGPSKESVRVTPGGIRAGVEVVLDQTNTPLNVTPGMTVYVDVSAGPVNAILPSSEDPAPATGDPIKFLPMAGQYSVNPLTLTRNGNPIAGQNTDDVEVTTDDLAFELRYRGGEIGYLVLSLG